MRSFVLFCCAAFILFVAQPVLFAQDTTANPIESDSLTEYTEEAVFADDGTPRLLHVEGGFGGVIANDQGAAQRAEALMAITAQIPSDNFPFWIDLAFTGGLPIEKNFENGDREEFAFFGVFAGIGQTFFARSESWYYSFGGGMSFHFANLKIAPFAAPEVDENAALFGAYLRGNLMFRILRVEESNIYLGMSVQGEGTTTTHILGRRLNNNGVGILLVGGITGGLLP